MPLSKLDLRKTYNKKRSNIPASIRAQAGLSAAKIFIEQACFKENKVFAAYMCFKEEFAATPIIESIWQAKKQCYLPIVTAENTLEFVLYEYGDALHPNRYSILEPVNTARKISPQDLDVVLTPLVAFDLQGHRLGTGGGYYDRTFGFKRAATNDKPILIGLGYANQQADALPADSWDININSVLTEKKFISFV